MSLYWHHTDPIIRSVSFHERIRKKREASGIQKRRKRPEWRFEPQSRRLQGTSGLFAFCFLQLSRFASSGSFQWQAGRSERAFSHQGLWSQPSKHNDSIRDLPSPTRLGSYIDRPRDFSSLIFALLPLLLFVVSLGSLVSGLVIHEVHLLESLSLFLFRLVLSKIIHHSTALLWKPRRATPEENVESNPSLALAVRVTPVAVCNVMIVFFSSLSLSLFISLWLRGSSVKGTPDYILQRIIPPLVSE